MRLGGKRRQRGGVIGRFDDDFMRADAVHFVEHAFACAIQIAFDAERGKFVGNYANVPARCVALRRGPPLIGPVGQNLRWEF